MNFSGAGIFLVGLGVCSLIFSKVALMKNTPGDPGKVDADLADEADAIVNRTAHFVGDWIEEHVVDHPIHVPAGVDVAEEMASQCIEDAKEQGIEPDDIKDEVGDLKEYIEETLAEEHGSAESRGRPRLPPRTQRG
jgi:hypothetical protein